MTTPAGFVPDAPETAAVPAGFVPDGGDEHGVLKGAILDTFGMTNRPGAVPLTGDKATKTPLGVVLKPDNIAELAVREMVMAPLMALGPMGRIGAQGAIGAAEQLASGKGLESAGYAGLLDAAITALVEGAGGVVANRAQRLARPLTESREAVAAAQRAYQWASEAPQQALDALAHRFPGARVLIPSLDPAKKLTFQEAIDALKTKTGAAYQQGRDEIASWMNALDKQRFPKPRAGAVFKKQTSPERFTPTAEVEGTTMQRVAEAVGSAASNPAARSVTETAATTPADSTGFPVGAIPALAGWENLRDVARWLFRGAQ